MIDDYRQYEITAALSVIAKGKNRQQLSQGQHNDASLPECRLVIKDIIRLLSNPDDQTFEWFCRVYGVSQNVLDQVFPEAFR